MAKISVIIPIYNVENYLRECLESIVKQSFKDFEVICINDGSTDNSLDICNEYASIDSRFKIYSQDNQGQGVARNKGIDIATGDYLIFIDPDDYIDTNMFKAIYNNFEKYNVDIIQFDYDRRNENSKYKGNVSYSTQIKKHLKYKIKNNQIFNYQNFPQKSLCNISLCVWDKAYSSKLIKNNSIKNALNKHAEDHIFSLSANLLANKILYLKQTYYHYRQRNGSAVNHASIDNFCIFDNINLLKEFLIKHNLYNDYNDAFEEYAITILSWHYSSIPKENIEEYNNKAQNILSPKNYLTFKNNVIPKCTIIENIFSIKNKKINGIKHKYLKILGFEIELSNKRGDYD